MEPETLVKGYEQQFLRDLQELISIPSMRDEHSQGEGRPFGRETARALQWYLDKAAEMGFQVKNVDGYAGHVEYGSGEEILGILVHLDVVPAGDGWNSEPFTAFVNRDRVVGRGVQDNKGPAVAVLYALKALKDSGLPLAKRIRIIAGIDEESGMQCVEHYLKHEKMPNLCFSPDASFPLIHAEKGLLQLEICWRGSGPVLALRGGNRPNMVPEHAEVRLAEEALNALDSEPGLDTRREAGQLVITAKGKAAHASLPEHGVNALTQLLEPISRLDLAGQEKVLRKLAAIGRGIHGEGLGLEISDEVSGKLTCNLGLLEFAGDEGSAVLDIRSPVTFNLEETLAAAEARLVKAGFEVKVLSFAPPHHVPKDSEVVQKLLAVYRRFTGDNGGAIAIGGGTYARKVKGGVAFGPMLPGREEVAHTANEYMLLEDLNLCQRIYCRSMYELAK